MQYTEIIRKVGKDAGVSGAAAKSVVEGFLTEVQTALVTDTHVRLGALGTLKVRELQARVARNPKTGESIDVPARKRVRFDNAQSLIDAVNSGKVPKKEASKPASAKKDNPKEAAKKGKSAKKDAPKGDDQAEAKPADSSEGDDDLFN